MSAKSVKAIDLIKMSGDVTKDQAARRLNRDELAFGVKGVRVIHAGTPEVVWQLAGEDVRREIVDKLPPQMFVRSVELYEDNSINAYYSKLNSEHAEGFVRYRRVFTDTDVAAALRLVANALLHKYPYPESEWYVVGDGHMDESCDLHLFTHEGQRCATLYSNVSYDGNLNRTTDACTSMVIIGPSDPVEPELTPQQRLTRREK